MYRKQTKPVMNSQITYTLTAEPTSQGTLYTVTGTIDQGGSEESIVDQRFYDNEAAALEFMTAAMVPTALTFTPIEGIKNEYTAEFIPGFAVNLSKSWRGWSVTSAEHESSEIMDDYDSEAPDGTLWVKTKSQALQVALEFAQWFTLCQIENWADA